MKLYKQAGTKYFVAIAVHMIPCAEGGAEKLNNLRLLHTDCHKKVHSVLSRKQMAYWVKKGLNYISQKCILDIKKRPEAYAVVI